MGHVISDQQISQIGLNGRNYVQLLTLVPGEVSTRPDLFNPDTTINANKFNVVRTNSTYFTVDGAENLDNGGNTNAIVNLNVDAIAEVKIETSSYSAEFGGRSGAMVNMVTKSGTRDFHRTLFEFVRNDIFDA